MKTAHREAQSEMMWRRSLKTVPMAFKILLTTLIMEDQPRDVQ